MTQAFLLTSIGMVMGVTLLATSLVVAQSPRATHLWYLTGLLWAITALVVPPLAAELVPEYQTSFMSLSLLALMLLGPFLWLYIRAQTTENPWRLRRRDLWHFLPAMLALTVVVGFHLLPLPARETMVLRGQQPEGAPPAVLAIVTWLLLLLWLPLSLFYLLRAARAMLVYRRRIRDLFANLEQRELTRLLVFVAALCCVWLWAMVALTTSTLFNRDIVDRHDVTLMALIAVWALAVWGLRQRPGFEGHYGEMESGEIESVETESGEMLSREMVSGESTRDSNQMAELEEGGNTGGRPQATEKYRRSALDKARAERIASKIEHVMAEDKLYLEPDLTLTVLASRIGVGANYVSQTLNEYLGETFFDYVNRKRIEAAQRLLQDTNKSVLEVAYDVGFNARSSFYKSFRRVVGVTPKAFRQQAPASQQGIQ